MPMNTPVEQFIAERRREDPSFGGLLAKGFALLRCFVDDPRPLGNGELAQRLQLPRATVSRICRTLFELGYLDWDPKLDKYFVGAQVLALGYPYLAGLPVRTRVEGLGSVGTYGTGLTVLVAVPLPGRVSRPLRDQLAGTRGITETAQGLRLTVGPLSLLLIDPPGRRDWLLTGTVDAATLDRAAAEIAALPEVR